MSPALVVLLRLGARSLRLHKLRSSLSILGVVFGVAAVVAMSSVGEGARRETLAQIAALGIDTVTVKPPAPPAGEPAAHAAARRDADSLRAWFPACGRWRRCAWPSFRPTPAGRSAAVIALGTTPGYARGRAARARARGASWPTSTSPTASAWRCSGRRWRARSSRCGARSARACGSGGTGTRSWACSRGARRRAARGAAIRARDLNRAVLVPLPALDRGARPPRRTASTRSCSGSATPEDVVPAAGVAQALVRRAG